MNKKIRYAMGAVGALPALAMIPGQLAAPASHAGKTTATTGKKVRTIYARDAAFTATSSSASASPALTSSEIAKGSCKGTTGHHIGNDTVTVRFFSAPAGSRTCIGTIQTSTASYDAAGGGVNNINTVSRPDFCSFQGTLDISHIRCRRIFVRDKLSVSGTATNGVGAVTSIHSHYPFRKDGFH